MKITVIGGGNVGSTTALFIAMKELANEVVLLDITPDVPIGKGLDMYESMPVFGSDTKIIGTNSYDDTANSDIVIITAGVPRKPGMSRDDLLTINADILKDCATKSYAKSPNAYFIVVANPLDVLTYLTIKLTGLPRNRVLGMAGVLDTSRYKTFIAMELGVSVKNVDALVLGGHGDTMVPLPRYTTVGGIPVTDLIPKDKLDAIIARTANGGGEIVKYLKSGSAYYAPAASVTEMVEAIVKDKKTILPCSVLLEGEYGFNDVVMGMPVKLGKNFMEGIMPLNLNEEELAGLNKSASAVAVTIKEARELLKI